MESRVCAAVNIDLKTWNRFASRPDSGLRRNATVFPMSFARRYCVLYGKHFDANRYTIGYSAQLPSM